MGLTAEQVSATYDLYGHLILRRARFLLRSKELAMDVLQEVFVRLMKYGDAFLAANAPLRWLYRVTDRVCFDIFNKRTKTNSFEGPLTHEPSASDPGPERTAMARDLVLKFIRRMDDSLKQIVVLYFVDGLTQADIALEVGCSRQTVNKKLSLVMRRALVLKQSMGVA